MGQWANMLRWMLRLTWHVGWQVLTQVIEGEGIGWLKLNRVRKLMEDENYRMLVVSGLNRTLERKIGPDDHISDVVSSLLNLFISH